MELNFDHLILKPEEVDYIIYHGNCTDGFGCVISAELYRKEVNPEKQIIYYGASYAKPPPDITGKNVLICDFSYKKEEMLNIIKSANKVAVLDHHKTAETELSSIMDKYKVFNMNYSGAYITWKYFHPTKKVPKLIEYIQDNDLWRKQLPNTLEFTAYMFSLPMTIEEYSKLLDDNYIETQVLTQGSGMLRQNISNIENALKHVNLKFTEINNKIYMIGYVNSSVLKSEIGNKIFEKYPYCNFSAVYSIDDLTNSTIFSLRSTYDRTDVSEISKIFGGGGHRNASGMKCNYITNTLPGNVLDNFKSYYLLRNIYTSIITIDEYMPRAVILNSAHHKHALGRYLLQTRCYDITNEQIQECTFILRNLNNNDQNYNSDISIIWNFQGNNKIWCTVIASNDVYNDKKKYNRINQYFSKYDDFIQNDNKINFSCKTNCLIDSLIKIKIE